MIKREDIIEIGSLNKPHGISGEISATFICDVDELSHYSCFIMDINGIYVPFFIDSIREKNAHTVLLKFNGLENEESVKRFIKHDVFVLKREYIELDDEEEDEDSEDDEASSDYFIGYKIIDSSHGDIGEIIDVDDSTDNYLFVVSKDDSEIFIPVTTDFITKVDEDAAILYMTLPEGLLDL